MTSKTISTNEKDYLLSLVKNRQQYRMGVLFPSRMNNYYYDAGTGSILRLQDSEYRLLKAIFSPTATQESVNDASLKEDPVSLEKFLVNTAEMNLLRLPPITHQHCNCHSDICQQIDQNLTQLILEVTQRCNFRCKYCIYNSTYDGNHDFSSSDMNWNTAKQAIDYLFDHSSKRENIYLTFYGGEPLLKFDLIKQCTAYAQQQAELKGRNLYFNLTTNLSLMTEEIANYFAAIPHFSLAVSIDGPAECNAARVYANGSETFPDVERGLHLICHAFNKVGKSLTISSVLTPPYDFEKLDRMNKYIEDFPEMPKDSSVVITYPSAGTYDSDAYVKTINNNPRYWDLGAFDPLAKWQLTQAIRNSLSWDHTNNLYFRTLIEAMTRIKNRFASSEPALRTGIIEACCVPAVRKLYVHTDGELSICERIGSSPSVGTISTGVNKEVVLKKYIDDYLTASKPLCENCWAYNICPMCYSECYSQNGVNIKEKSSKCKSCRTYTYLMLGTFCTLMEERPEIMETLNHTVPV